MNHEELTWLEELADTIDSVDDDTFRREADRPLNEAAELIIRAYFEGDFERHSGINRCIAEHITKHPATHPHYLVGLLPALRVFNQRGDRYWLSGTLRTVAAALRTRAGGNSSRSSHRITSAQRDILRIIDNGTPPLTQTKIIDALASEGLTASEGMTKQNLAELVRAGVLENKRNGAGYRRPAAS